MAGTGSKSVIGKDLFVPDRRVIRFLDAVRGESVVVYKHSGRSLGPEQGGPVRFLIKDPTACHTSELDDCANVKYLSRIELTVRRGRDTRPADDVPWLAAGAAGAYYGPGYGYYGYGPRYYGYGPAYYGPGYGRYAYYGGPYYGHRYWRR